jgi:hypothetical protein
MQKIHSPETHSQARFSELLSFPKLLTSGESKKATSLSVAPVSPKNRKDTGNPQNTHQ